MGPGGTDREKTMAIPTKMKSAFLNGTRNMIIQMVDTPQPGFGEVLVRIEKTGICGSDVHYYEYGRIGDHLAEGLTRLGHESAGIVDAVGSGVKTHKIGDRVSIEPQKTCMHCEYCLTGRYNLCSEVVFLASPPVPGTFCEYVAHPAEFCFHIPDGMSMEEGALIEPLAVGFQAAAQAEAVVGQSAVVLGAGCIGLCTMMALQARGVRNVFISDVIEKRLEKAKELGAMGAFNPSKEDVVQAVLDATNGKGVDIAIETSGAKTATESLMLFCKRGASVVFVGQAANPIEITFRPRTFISKELTFRAVFRYRNVYPACIDAARCIPLPLKSIISKTYRFDQIGEAFEYNVEHRNEVVKIVIDHTK